LSLNFIYQFPSGRVWNHPSAPSCFTSASGGSPPTSKKGCRKILRQPFFDVGGEPPLALVKQLGAEG